MTNLRLKAQLALVLLCAPAGAQTPAKQDAGQHDFSKEGAVIERLITKVAFQSDGTYTREQHLRVRIQSDPGVRQYGVLPFPYEASVERVEVLEVRVTSPSGSIVETPLDTIQDVTSKIFQDAPLYSDLREKHVAVKGLEPGDTLEFSVRWSLEKPLAPGQFWTSHQFIKSAVVLDEELEISVPHEREAKLKSQSEQPTMHEENGRRVYVWKTSNLESQSVEKQKQAQSYDAMRGMLPPPDVLISSFHTWKEIGRWYESLQQEKIQPSPEVKAKAEELTKGLSDDDSKLRALYNYVSLRYRYVAISFGIGRYQPHAAAEILGNQYGDCKDKHTLLAALSSAVGIRVYPALINSRASVDVDVPSPGQFDHVISVLRRGKSISWMDTTPEVTAIGYLVMPLRGKTALVITPDEVDFQNTPADPPYANKDTGILTAKLDTEGTLHGHLEATFRGDTESYFRYVFRRVPESEWKDYGQQNFYGGRLGGTISDVGASPPEKTEEPFTMRYDYTLKDFSGGEKHRFTIPMGPFGLPEVSDEDMRRKTPLWIGYIGDSQHESRIELPKGWTAEPPTPLHLKESFADFETTTEVKEGILITKRRLLLKADSVTPDQLKSYKTFQKAVSDDHRTYVYLRSAASVAPSGPATTPAQGIGRVGELLRQGAAQLPSSSIAEALQAEQDGRKSLQTADYSSGIAALKRAVSLDPTFSRAWLELGATYYGGTRELSPSFNAFQKAVEADPKQVIPYKVLAFLYMGIGRRSDAIDTWKKLQGLAPDDPDLMANLGGLYMAQNRYSEATLLFESAAKAHPSDAFVQMRLGAARLRAHNAAQGLEAMHKALEIDPGAGMLNEVAYEMAETGTNIPEALDYSQRSVKDVEERSRKIDVTKVEKADLQLPLLMSAYWDTLGWIYFKMGDLKQAETYLNSAWELGQDGVVGDHMGQLYEKRHKLPEALHMYNLALEANPRLPETPARMRALVHVHLPEHRVGAGEEMSQMRTFKLPNIVKETATADLDLVIMAGGKVDKANFLKGSELLRNAGETLEKTPFKVQFPAGSTAHLLRRGVLSCSPYTGCSFVFYPISVAATAR